MRTRVEDLRKGDVILLPSAKGLYEAKLLRQPVKATQGKLITWWGAPRWRGVMCAVRSETFVRQYTNWSGVSTPYNYTKLVIAGDKEYNKEKRIDLTDMDVWLIKREQV